MEEQTCNSEETWASKRIVQGKITKAAIKEGQDLDQSSMSILKKYHNN